MSENDNKGITFESWPDSGSTETIIHVFFVDIANIKDSLKILKQEVFDCVKES